MKHWLSKTYFVGISEHATYLGLMHCTKGRRDARTTRLTWAEIVCARMSSYLSVRCHQPDFGLGPGTRTFS